MKDTQGHGSAAHQGGTDAATRSAAFAAAKAQQETLEAETARTGAVYGAFPKDGPLGLTSDATRAKPEFQAAKAAFDQAFGKLQKFNSGFVKEFKGELRDARRARDAARSKG